MLSQYYTDDRGAGTQVSRGAKVVADYQLQPIASSSDVKNNPVFAELIEEIRQAGFDPKYLQHAKDFNLNHPDAFQTLTEEEYNHPGM